MEMENQTTVDAEETGEGPVSASTTLPPEIHALLEAEAIAEDRTISAQIRRIIVNHYRNTKGASA